MITPVMSGLDDPLLSKAGECAERATDQASRPPGQAAPAGPLRNQLRTPAACGDAGDPSSYGGRGAVSVPNVGGCP